MGAFGLRRIICILLTLGALLSGLSPAGAAEKEYIKWVDFDVSCEAMEKALALSTRSMEQERPLPWLSLLALGACRTGGKVTASGVEKAYRELSSGKSPGELLGKQYKYYEYYLESYEAALGGLVGCYAIEAEEDGKRVWKPAWGIKAFFPIAAGYGYSHYDDFGADRSYGFRRRHLGNDLMGAAGTPIVAVEGGTVEAMGWNQYGGWRVGIRSGDGKRYYYYAHLQKDAPFAPGLAVGQEVQAGQLLGFMGRTGYSSRENVNNIETVHLHFGLQLIFDESQKECNSEIWIDVYQLLRFLSSHRCSYQKDSAGNWVRVYPYKDLDSPD